MYRKKRYLVLVLVSVFTVLVALTPFLLSSPAVLHYFLSSVNRKIPGRLSIDSWLIGWQQGVLCQNVVYSNPEKGINIAIPSLASNRGLMELVLAPKNFGTVHVDSPLVELSRQTLLEFFATGKTAAAGTGEGRGPGGNEAPLWDGLFLDLKARDGQVKTVWDNQDFIVAFSNVSVDSTLAAGIASFEIGFHTLQQGFVEAAGTLNLPVHEHGWLETIITEAVVKISSLQVEELLHAGAMLTKLPRGEGVMNGDFQFKATGLDHIEFSGLAELTDVSLSGGFLGDDQPSFRKFHIAAKQGKRTSSGWSFKELELFSDTLDMKMSGEFAPENLQLNARGSINLPVLFDQVPRLLKVNESVFMETGFLDFAVEAESGPHPSMKLKVKAGSIGGIFKDQRFSWNSPVSLLINGEKSGTGVRVNALQFDAPFGRAKGNGDLHSFVLDGEVDLDKALADAGMLFQLGWSGAGKMDLLVKSGPAENNGDRIRIDTNLDIEDFMLFRHDKQVVPRHLFSLIGGFEAPNTFFDHGTGELDLQVVLSSWLGEVYLVMNGEKSGDRPFRTYYTTDSEIDLGQLAALLDTFHILGNGSEVDGALQLQAAGFAGGSPLEIRDLSAEITDFILEGNGTVFAEPRVHLQIIQPVNEEAPFLSMRELKVAADKDNFFRYGAGLNLVDLSQRRLTLHNMRLESESVTAVLDRLVIPDWREPVNGIRPQFSLSAELAKMTEGFKAVGLLPADMAFTGSSEIAVQHDEKDESTQEMNLDVQVDGFSLARRNKMLIDCGNVLFSSRVRGRIPFGEMMVEELSLRSRILDLDGAGKVSEGGTMRMLELSGNMTPALDNVASILAEEFNMDLKMEGQPEERFVLKFPLGNNSGGGNGQLDVSSSLHADSITFDGLELHTVSLPFHFADSMLHMELSSRMNEGGFDFAADTDFTADPPVMKTSGSRQVMTGVKLNDPLISILLSRFHPLFGGLAQPNGLIDARLDSLWWPMGEGGKNEANLVTIFNVRGIELESKSQLKNILTLFELEKEKLKLRDNEIYCIGKKGRIKCSPVRVMAGDVEIVLSGSTALDRSLAYEIEVPITGKLVSTEESRPLDGAGVKVAVTGTIEDPAFDKETVTSEIQRLLKQVADETNNKTDGT